MSVSDAVRKQVKERAGGACQLFHREEFPGCMVVHPEKHQGIGGMPEDSEVNQPEKLVWGCQPCHDLIDARGRNLVPFKVIEIDADHCDEDGNPSPIFRIADHKGIEVPQRNIWLHARLIKQQLGELLTSVRGDRMFESDRANAMLQLYDDFDLITPDAVSPEQMLAAEGFDSEVALKQVQAAAWIELHGLDWPRGLVVSKVSKFRSAAQKRLWTVCDKKLVQNLLNAAVDQSKSDISETFAEMGITISQPRMYVLIWASGEVTLARITDLQILKDRVAGRFSPTSEVDEKKKHLGPMVISAQKFCQGFIVKRGKLNYSIKDQLGNEIPYLTDEDLLKEELPVALWRGGATE